MDLPNKDTIKNKSKITLYKGPPGTDFPPDNYETITKDELSLLEWEPIKIGKGPSYKQSLHNYGSFAWRVQYGLRNHISSTIHGVMGSTLLYLVTNVVGDKYKLWEAEQVVVLLSRTKHLEDIYFIGDKKDNIESLWSTLKIRNQYSNMLAHLIERISKANNTTEPFVIREVDYTWVKPKNIQLPAPGIPCCYLLISEPHPHVTYIGSTGNLAKRINQHNSKCGGSLSTRSLRHKPWHVYAYVTGFSSRLNASLFEYTWHHQSEQGMNADIILNTATTIATNTNYSSDGTKLVITQCGSIIVR